MFKREIKKKSIILPPNKYYRFGDSLPGFSHMCTLKKKKKSSGSCVCAFKQRSLFSDKDKSGIKDKCQLSCSFAWDSSRIR